MKFSRSVYVKLAAATLALAAAGTASVAQARSDVYFSVGAHVAPGVSIGVSNAPVYYPPVYAAPVYAYPAPVYVRPAPIVVAAPTYYSYGYARPAPIYVAPAPVFYGHPGHRKHNKHWKQGHRHGYRY
jgi:hypothetical protein